MSPPPEPRQVGEDEPAGPASALPAAQLPAPRCELTIGAVDDAAATCAQLAVTRALLHADASAQVPSALVEFVHRLGGVVRAAAESGPDALPVDLSFGTTEPILADAEPMSLARMRLERLLPSVVEDARVVVSRLLHVEDVQAAVATDSLTGLASRRQLMRTLARAQRGDAVAVLDLDHFKAVNDREGHAAGDVVLSAFGALLRAMTRPEDCAGRFGGEEFGLLLTGTPVEVVVDRLTALRARWVGVRPLAVSFSGGVAAVDARGGLEALRIADGAMYDAKAAGRDRIVTADVAATGDGPA